MIPTAAIGADRPVRARRRASAVRLALATAIAAMAAVVVVAASQSAGSDLTVQITSPLGRTGLPGAVRIVAQVRKLESARVMLVRFYVDGVLLQEVDKGPPFAVDWTDENPFEARHITVEAYDTHGNSARDEITLAPFELTEATEVTSVRLEVGVYDKEGRFVSGLQPVQFDLSEDGVRQDVQLVAQEQIPATFALLVDSSQSMSRRFDFVQRAAATLASYLRPKDSIIVAPFSKSLGALTGPTSDKATVMEAIGAIRAQGGTAIYDSIIEIARRLEGMPGRHSVILITDAYDENSAATLDDALDVLKAGEITAYVVEIGGIAGISGRGQQTLASLAEATGGRAFRPPREEELPQVYDRLAADAQNRYIITYTPKNQRRDGTWRAIELKTEPTSFRVRTREGYFAPQPPPVRPVIEFTALDPEERYVDISADDLLVLEDGVEQKVEAFHEATAPVSIILALDASGSMLRATPAVIEAAWGFVKALRDEDGLGVMMFADEPKLVHDISTERRSVLETIAQYRPAHGTALYDALYDSLVRLKRTEGRRVVIVMTDGRDEDRAGTAAGSLHKVDDVLAQVRESGAVVFAVGIGENVDRPLLEEVTHMSGGRAYFPADVTTLPDEYRLIMENLRRRYALSYTSTNSTRDGQWRKVEIRSRSANIMIRSAGGYYAPAQ